MEIIIKELGKNIEDILEDELIKEFGIEVGCSLAMVKETIEEEGDFFEVWRTLHRVIPRLQSYAIRKFGLTSDKVKAFAHASGKQKDHENFGNCNFQGPHRDLIKETLLTVGIIVEE